MKRIPAEQIGGLVLFLSAIVAMAWANSPFSSWHERFIDHTLFIINDGLMCVFFLAMGLELKRGYHQGEFKNSSQILLPAIAALGGMLVPALVYLTMTSSHTGLSHGWATPVATDIAFALGVLSIFHQRIPPGLKLFLLALAIFDDLGAIIIIAFFYSHSVSTYFLAGVVLIIACLYLLQSSRVKSLIPYLLLSPLLWLMLLKAGMHPTLGGAILALFLPERIYLYEKKLHHWVNFLILPLFALANAGFSLAGIGSHFNSPVAWGIVLGLFLGKQLGVFGTAWFLIKVKLAQRPGRCTWQALYGVSIICGIGFTMSLFLGTLSFQGDSMRLIDVRLGVLIGSMLSALAGSLVLMGSKRL